MSNSQEYHYIPMNPNIRCKTCGNGPLSFTRSSIVGEDGYTIPRYYDSRGYFCSAGCSYLYKQNEIK